MNFGNIIPELSSSTFDVYLKKVNLKSFGISKLKVDYDEIIKFLNDDSYFNIAFDSEWETFDLKGTPTDILISMTFMLVHENEVVSISYFNKGCVKRKNSQVPFKDLIKYLNDTYEFNLSYFHYKLSCVDNQGLKVENKKIKYARREKMFTKASNFFEDKKTIRLIGFFQGVDLRWLDFFCDYQEHGFYQNKKFLIVKDKHMVFSRQDVCVHGFRYCNSRNLFVTSLKFQFRDVMCLAPPKTNLDSLGQGFLGIAKDDADDWKHRMLDYYQEKPGDYVRYAIRDVFITLLLFGFITKETGSTKPTISGIAMEKYVNTIKHPDESKTDFEKRTRGYTVDNNGVRDYAGGMHPDFAKLLVECEDKKLYKGGLNTCNTMGWVNKLTFDYDLLNAYGFSMVILPLYDILSAPYKSFTKIDFKDLNTEDKEIFKTKHLGSVGWGIVDYKIPEDCKSFIPCYDEKGNVYHPRQAEKQALTLSEVITLNELGAEIYFRIFSIPRQKTVCTHPLSRHMEKEITKREFLKKKFGKGSPQEQLQKILINTNSGKTGQGLNEKLIRNFITGEIEEIIENIISSSYLAGCITGLVRSILGLCIEFIEKQGYKVYSVTTDGFITDFGDINKLNEYLIGLSPNFKKVLNKLGLTEMLEEKHRQKSFLNIKTRFNVSSISDEKGVLACVGLRKFKTDKDTKNFVFENFNNPYITQEKSGITNLYDVKKGSVKSLNRNVTETVVLLHDHRKIPYLVSDEHLELRDPKDMKEGKKATNVFQMVKRYKFNPNILGYDDYIIRYNIMLDKGRQKKLLSRDDYIRNEIKLYKNYPSLTSRSNLSKDELFNVLNEDLERAGIWKIGIETFAKLYKYVKSRDINAMMFVNDDNRMEILKSIKDEQKVSRLKKKVKVLEEDLESVKEENDKVLEKDFRCVEDYYQAYFYDDEISDDDIPF